MQSRSLAVTIPQSESGFEEIEPTANIYQVMGANVPSWTAKHYGRRLTPEQFRNSPAAQEAVARGVLKGYWNKYGARGAASAWYSGNPNLHMSTRSQSGGPSIKTYVDQVLAKAGRYPAGGGGGSGGTTTSSGTGYAGSAPKPMARDELAEQYGFVEALFNSDRELKKLFDKAVKGGWSASKFQAELRDTKWWKRQPKSAREFLVLKYGDPATANQKLSQAQIKIASMAKQLGAPAGGAQMKAMALKAVMNGWTDEQLRYQIGKTINLKGDARPGEAGEAQDKLSSYAYDMGIALSDSWLDSAAKTIVSGMGTSQDYEDKIRQMAKATFSNWAKQIDAGQTVADLAAPYLQTMGQILELPGGSVNLFDKTIKGALQYKDPQTGLNAVKPLWQFENDLRGDQRWKQTKNAQDSIMQVAHQVLSDFGVKY